MDIKDRQREMINGMSRNIKNSVEEMAEMKKIIKNMVHKVNKIKRKNKFIHNLYKQINNTN